MRWLADGSKVTALDWFVGSNAELAEYLRSIGAKTAEQVLGIPQVSVPSEDEVETALIRHFSKKFGPVAKGAVQQIVPDIVDTRIRWVPPGGKSGVFRKRSETYLLFTVGMSRRPQYVPFGELSSRYPSVNGTVYREWAT